MTGLQELINKIKAEDHSAYLALLNKINGEKMDRYAIGKLFASATFTKITNNQLLLLRSMSFKGGDTIWLSTYNRTLSSFENRFQNTRGDYQLKYGIDSLPKVDTKFITTYHRTQWRKANPSTRKNGPAKGTQFTFKMDMFSLTIFKNSIKNEFLRTEGKNFIMKVNKAFSESEGNDSHTKIRNKFYALILDNTPVHTKAMINELSPTALKTNGTYYIPDADEAIIVGFRWGGDNEVSYATSYSMDTYSTDLPLVTHNIGSEDERHNNRLLSASSMLLTAHASTDCEAYKSAATRMVKHLPRTIVTAALAKTQAVATLRSILKESNE